MCVWSGRSAAVAAAAALGADSVEEAVGVGAAVDETVGVVWVVDAAVIVGGTAADAETVVVVDAETVVVVVVGADVDAAEFQTFPGDASVAARQARPSDRLGRSLVFCGHAAALAAAAAAAAAPSGAVSGAVLGPPVSSGAANGTGGVFAVPAAASCRGSRPDADQTGSRCAVDDPEAPEAPLTGSALEVLEKGSGPLRGARLDS